MMLRTDKKDEVTEAFRQLVGRKVPDAVETKDAELSLSTLSFQSTIQTQRHVWLDKGDEGITIDLEDWNIEDEWDNAVARVTVASWQEALELINIWLSGADLKNYVNLNKEYKPIFKIQEVSVG